MNLETTFMHGTSKSQRRVQHAQAASYLIDYERCDNE
jgi:hypothetical protein